MDINSFKKQFGNEASNYTKYRRPYPDELQTLLFSLIPKDSKKILDIACGTGKSTELLLKSGLEVYGCDHDSLMVEEAEKQANNNNLNINYKVADVKNLPYEDSTFDVVTIGTAFHFFVDEKSISEIKRVLKKNGLIYIYWTLTTKEIPKEDEIPGSIFESYGWVRIPSELRNLENISSFLLKSGFENVSTSQIPFSYLTTVEERIGLQTTSGMYELLSKENKNKFLSEVETVLKEKLGNRDHFVLEEEIQICYGFMSD